ncbi:hypothetical protein LTR56_011519 [Elasticomyces elasticus]|nr:hypothetical protein LTR56_011519 [Elasticomyces elasticus]KAK3643248.1 hypothetical protein LTR22_015715 [Elasticomyces elasticus]KAK5761402.1 hypothetical protein LTS12_008506 [Elasticomyces elasticus]
MATTPPILTLPLELLQHTFDVVFSKHSRHGLRCEDMLSLRLVCREISAAVFDQFVAAYLRERTCCAANNDQLDKLVLYLETQPFARELRIVTFTLRTGNSDQVEPDIDRLQGVAQRLVKQKCELDLDFGPQGAWGDFTRNHYYTRTILETLAGKRCYIRGLSASEISLPDMRPDRQDTPALLSVLAGLRTLRCDFNFVGDRLRYHVKHESMAELVATASGLKELEIMAHLNPEGPRLPGPYCLAGKIFLAVKSRHLTSVRLRFVLVEPEALIQCLRRSQATLRCLQFRQVSLLQSLEGIPHDSEAWTEVFSVMPDMPLEDLLVQDCYLATEYPARRISVRPHPRWVEYWGDHEGDRLDLNEQGSRRIRERLSATLKRGLMLD